MHMVLKRLPFSKTLKTKENTIFPPKSEAFADNNYKCDLNTLSSNNGQQEWFLFTKYK